MISIDNSIRSVNLKDRGMRTSFLGLLPLSASDPKRVVGIVVHEEQLR